MTHLFEDLKADMTTDERCAVDEYERGTFAVPDTLDHLNDGDYEYLDENYYGEVAEQLTRDEGYASHWLMHIRDLLDFQPPLGGQPTSAFVQYRQVVCEQAVRAAERLAFLALAHVTNSHYRLSTERARMQLESDAKSVLLERTG